MSTLALRLGRPGEDFGPLTPMSEPAERWLRWDLWPLVPARAVLRKQPAADLVMALDGWEALVALLSSEGRRQVEFIRRHILYRCTSGRAMREAMLPVAVLTRDASRYTVALKDVRMQALVKCAWARRAPRVTRKKRQQLGHGYDDRFNRIDGRVRAEWMYLELTNGDLVACIGLVRYPRARRRAATHRGLRRRKPLPSGAGKGGAYTKGRPFS